MSRFIGFSPCRATSAKRLGAGLFALCLGVWSCGGEGGLPPPAQAPTQVAACLTFVLEEAPPPNLDAYDRQVIEGVRKAVTAELVAAGFAIVDSRDKPFDVVLRLTANPGSRIETNAQLRGTFTVEGTSGPIDTVEAGAPKDAPGAAEAVAASLVDGLFRSGSLGGYIKQLRRPGSTGLARTSLRNMAPACEGFVVTTPTATAAASAAPDATSAPVSSAAPEAKPPAPALLAGAAQPDAFAIVFGVEQYKSAPGAPGARADAEKVARLVTQTLGVPEAHVKIALDQKADRLAIDLNLEWLKLNVPKGGRVYFYFAGNGWAGKPPGSASLMPYDADPKTGAKTVSLASLLKGLSETKAADSILIVDAAFAGAGGRSVAAGEAPLMSLKGTTPPVRTVLLSAVSGAEGARADASGGAFTHFLMEGLGSGRADANADGRVTLQETVAWVGARVGRAAKREGKAQTPGVSLGPAVLPVDKLAVVTGLESP
jgi:hypothetical protein